MKDRERCGVKYRADLSQFVDGNAETYTGRCGSSHSADAAEPELNLKLTDLI